MCLYAVGGGDCMIQNSKLQDQVNKSSVQAVDEAYKKQKEAEKQLQLLRYQAEQSRRTAEKEIQKLKKRMKLQSEKNLLFVLLRCIFYDLKMRYFGIKLWCLIY